MARARADRFQTRARGSHVYTILHIEKSDIQNNPPLQYQQGNYRRKSDRDIQLPSTLRTAPPSKARRRRRRRSGCPNREQGWDACSEATLARKNVCAEAGDGRGPRSEQSKAGVEGIEGSCCKLGGQDPGVARRRCGRRTVATARRRALLLPACARLRPLSGVGYVLGSRMRASGDACLPAERCAPTSPGLLFLAARRRCRGGNARVGERMPDRAAVGGRSRAQVPRRARSWVR